MEEEEQRIKAACDISKPQVDILGKAKKEDAYVDIGKFRHSLQSFTSMKQRVLKGHHTKTSLSLHRKFKLSSHRSDSQIPFSESITEDEKSFHLPHYDSDGVDREDMNELSDDEDDVDIIDTLQLPQILYISRTHSQITQVYVVLHLCRY